MDYAFGLQLETVGYFIEVLAAELMFLHRFKKRKSFWTRLAVGTTIALFVVSQISLAVSPKPLVRFALLFIVIAVSIALLLFCFEGDRFSVISSCIAGVATQHIANKTISLLLLVPFISAFNEISSVYRIATEVIVSAIVYIIIYFIFAREHVPEKSSMHINLLSVIVVLTCIGVNRLVADHVTDNVYYEIAACIYAIICCLFALMVQFYLYKWQQEKSEKLVINGLLSASEKQYEQWKAMVEFTNIQTHDLKHLLDRIERLSASSDSGKENAVIPNLSPIRESLNNFSPLVKTGNDVLDVLLRNMNNLCRQQNVRFNCVSYTNRLDAFDSMPLYFLFANAIDNARAGAMTVSDEDKRLVDVSIRQFGDSVVIHIWNYYSGDISFEDEMPISKSTEEGHGFGLKSIKLIADRFGGAMKAYTEGDIFHLNLILPL